MRVINRGRWSAALAWLSLSLLSACAEQGEPVADPDQDIRAVDHRLDNACIEASLTAAKIYGRSFRPRHGIIPKLDADKSVEGRHALDQKMQFRPPSELEVLKGAPGTGSAELSWEFTQPVVQEGRRLRKRKVTGSCTYTGNGLSGAEGRYVLTSCRGEPFDVPVEQEEGAGGATYSATLIELVVMSGDRAHADGETVAQAVLSLCDMEPPVIELFSPSNEARVGDNFTVTGRASDNFEVAGLSYEVQYFHTSVDVTEGLGPEGDFSFSMNLPPGLRSLLVSATDMAGNVSRAHLFLDSTGCPEVTIGFCADPLMAATLCRTGPAEESGNREACDGLVEAQYAQQRAALGPTDQVVKVPYVERDRAHYVSGYATTYTGLELNRRGHLSA